jgi:hypothetical protein
MWLHPKSDPLKEKPWWMIANPPSSPKYSKKKKEKKIIQGNNGYESSKAHNYVYKRKKLFHKVSSKLLLGREVVFLKFLFLAKSGDCA